MVDERGRSYFIDESEGKAQINILDKRYTVIDGEKYVNVTEWLQAAPRGKDYDECLMSLGHGALRVKNEEEIVSSHVHKYIARILKGDTVEYKEGITSVLAWEYFMAWCRFFKRYCEVNEVVYNPQVDVETIVHYDNPEDSKFNFAGIVDLKAIVGDDLSIFD